MVKSEDMTLVCEKGLDIQANDRVYVNVIPSAFDGTAHDADFYTLPPKISLNSMSVTLRRLGNG